MNVAELLKDFDDSHSEPTNKTPLEFKRIKERFQEVKESNTPVLLEMSSIHLAHSVVLYLEYIGDRWCMGRVHYHTLNGDESVPYTIHYSDVLVGSQAFKVPKVVVKGESPYE